MSSNFTGLHYIICECGVNFSNEEELLAHLRNKHIATNSNDDESDFYILELEDDNDTCNGISIKDGLQKQKFLNDDFNIKVEPKVECSEEDQSIYEQSVIVEHNVPEAININDINSNLETLNYVVVNTDLTQESEIVNFDVEYGNEIVLEDNVSYTQDGTELVITEIPNLTQTDNINSDQIMFCELCEKVFVGEQTFQEHYDKVHTLKTRKKSVPKIWSCTTCDKTFASKFALQSHIYTHTGERPFKCSTCDSSFAVKLRLQIHERIHTDERPFQCERCPKSFRNQAAIQRHSRVHTGIKPYACPQCGKTFTQSNSMKLHVRTVHLKEPAPYKSKKRVMKDIIRMYNGLRSKT